MADTARVVHVRGPVATAGRGPTVGKEGLGKVEIHFGTWAHMVFPPIKIFQNDKNP